MTATLPTEIKPVANRQRLTPEGADYLVMIQSLVTERNPEFYEGEGTPAKIVYYCRDCKKNVQAVRIPGKLRFTCAECQGERVAFGTEASVENFYRGLRDERPEN